MAHPQPLPLGESNSSPVYPDAWVELTPGPLSYESSAPVTIPTTEDISSFDLKSYGSYGPDEILLPHLDGANRPMSNLYSIPMALPQDPSYKTLEGTTFKSQDASGPYQQCAEAYPNFGFSSSGGYESSLSPSSSRPCTAGYEVDGMGFSSSLPEPPLSLPYGYGFLPTDGFSFYSPLEHIALDPNLSPKSAAGNNHNSFPLQSMPPYLIQHSDVLLGPHEEMAPLVELPVDLQFPTGSAAAHYAIPIDIPEKYAWSSALSNPPRPRTDGHFAHHEVFTTRCVQPTSLMGQPARGAKSKHSDIETNYGAHGKASFVSGNWENQDVFCNENSGYSPPPPPKKAAVGKKRPKRRNSAIERLTNSDSPGTKTNNSALSCSRGSDNIGRSQNPAKQSSAAAENKTPDGKYVCSRICKDTQVVCGRKFQRSEHLKRHWATHEDIRPHQCQICERFFGRTE
ncbi:uncharacterized protein PGTG_04923 [Puccinia graminis f. sp. tritici CRL 75-36-700-3]|uniref:C2H2-type domain-containing protein n=1 Tax=Puccinia graminis f. sp. tritici (strain CRL 75-36-700-3 / race SCCL) TaxID=418459 RepID=E3K3B0_PUCGT|nr:uncharacterized protein PGTG_04923 [Puccinia graminis f. sp. tritici CRL 75-36-700-3]EFP78967.2 hypothetical protein PGTG_04923 [Puccinia graminis f. sp. tritici CRL 75-36-700-3]